MWERIGVAWTLCWGAPRASTRSLASVFRQARRGSARRVSDGAPSCGALCSSGVSLLTELTPVLLRIVRRAQVSEACERGDRGEGVGMRDRRAGENPHTTHTRRCDKQRDLYWRFSSPSSLHDSSSSSLSVSSLAKSPNISSSRSHFSSRMRTASAQSG